jgi:RNA polymerase sigma-70 factor (ECF subfamily)
VLVDDHATLINDPDAVLLAGLRAGDEQAFAALVRRHGAALLRHARTFVRSETVAEDVVQETWLAVVTGVERFEGRALLRTWLYGIVANRGRTRALRERRSVPFSSLVRDELDGDRGELALDRFQPRGGWAIAPQPWPDEQYETRETLAVVRDAIDALPPVQREVVRLRDVEGWDPAEICAKLGISAGNQRVLLHRGRTRVRAALEQELAAPAPVLAAAA